MDNHSNQKVYINPNFNRTGTYLNQNFTHQLMMQNNQRKIFVNPNFIAINKSHINSHQVNSHQQQHGIDQKSPIKYQNEVFNVIKQAHTTQTTKGLVWTEDKHLNPLSKAKFVIKAHPECIQTLDKISSPAHAKPADDINMDYNQKFVNRQYNSNLGVTKPKEQNNLANQVKNDKIRSTVAPLVKSRYCLVNKKSVSKTEMPKILQKSQLHNTIQPSHSTMLQANYKSPKVHSTKSRYCFIRNNNPLSPNIRSLKKNVTIKLSKYKMISMRNFNTEHKPRPQLDQSYLLKKVSVVKSNTPTIAKFTPSAVIVKNTNTNVYKLKRLNTNSKNLSSEIETVKINSPSIKRNHNFITKKYSKGSFKINNIPCPLYTKYGKCLRKEKGSCEYLHDKKHVSLCRKFLKGICHDDYCLLSHELSDKKMPTCYFYLKGMCTKEHCPYVHIKLSENIKDCQDFLKGYCEKGNKCVLRHVRKRHYFGMPGSSLNKSGKIAHSFIKKTKSYTKIVNSTDYPSKTAVREKLNSDNRDLEGRYYKGVGAEEDQYCEIIKPSRCKLGTLPSYIQLK